MRRLTDEQRIEAKQRYLGGESFTDIARDFNCRPETVSKFLKRRGVVSRRGKKFICNEDFFKVIDKPEKAYFLGWLYADGYVDEIRGKTELRLAAKDKLTLSKLNLLIYPNGDRKLLIKRAKKSTWQDNYLLYISNRKMTMDLVRLDCRQNKSFSVKFPTFDIVPEHIFHFFIRGYFDGDGCICMKRNGAGTLYATASIVSSDIFVEKFVDFFEKRGIVFHSEFRDGISIASTNAIQTIKKFYDYLYEGDGLFLKRKKRSFEKAFKLKDL